MARIIQKNLHLVEEAPRRRSEAFAVCEKLKWLGVSLDEAQNEKTASAFPRLTAAPVWVIPTNEEFMIAEHAQAIKLQDELKRAVRGRCV